MQDRERLPDSARRVDPVRVPRLVRLLGLVASALGVFLAVGMAAGIVGAQAMFHDVDTVGTLADWMTAVVLVVAGVGLRRGASWASSAASVAGVAMLAFGCYWAVWGDDSIGAPLPNPLTGAGLPWGIFVTAGLLLVVAAAATMKARRVKRDLP